MRKGRWLQAILIPSNNVALSLATLVTLAQPEHLMAKVGERGVRVGVWERWRTRGGSHCQRKRQKSGRKRRFQACPFSHLLISELVG